MQNYLGHADFSKILTLKTQVIAYDYNCQKSRLNSKYYSNINPNIYDVKIRNATWASSATPTYFNPVINIK